MREVPQSIEMEAAVLGACLLSPLDCIPLAQSTLKIGCEAFYDLRHRAIFKVMEELDSQRIQADPTAVIQRLKDSGLLEQVGLSYVATLPEACSSSANIKHYLDVVKQKSLLRQCIELCEGTIEKAYEAQGEYAVGVVESLEVDLKSLSENAVVEEFSLKGHVSNYIKYLEEDWNKPTTGIGSGLGDLDRATDFYRPGQMIVIASAPGVGKSTLAHNIAYHNFTRGRPVGFFSMEMSGDELVECFVSMHISTDSRRIRYKQIDQSEQAELVQATHWIVKQPLMICDKSGMTINEVRSRARRWVMDRKVELLILDYLQLFSAGKKCGNRAEEVAYVSTQIKAMASELKVPIIVLSQFNRVHKKEDREPRNDDLKESGSIEADASKIILLHPKDEDPVNRVTQAHVSKNRGGRAGDKIELLFKKPIHRFCLLEKGYQ